MFDLLHKNISDKIRLSESDWALCKGKFILNKLRKKQYFLQAGALCDQVAFVNKGLLRSYFIHENGEEYITQFAPEGWWISDLNSFLTGERALYNIDALEDSELLLLDRSSQESLFEQAPVFERFFRLLIQSSFLALHQRMLSTVTQSAEEKYLRIQKTYPDLIQRVPQHMVASYLALKPETLSRIRKKLAEDRHP